MEEKTLSGYSIRIRKIRESLDLKIAEFARKLEVPRSTLVGWEEGKAVSIDILKPLEKLFSVDVNWLLTGEGEMYLASQENAIEKTFKTGFKQIPVYSEKDLPEGAFIVPLIGQKLSAGEGSFLPEEDQVKALVHVPAYLSRYGDKIAALTVDGDSMYPTLHRGDMVVCDSYGWSGDGIYALRMRGTGLVKRLTKAPGKYVILSDNPKYPPREEPEESEDIQIIGRVHCAITQLE